MYSLCRIWLICTSKIRGWNKIPCLEKPAGKRSLIGAIKKGIALGASHDDLDNLIKKDRLLIVAQRLQESLGKEQDRCLRDIIKKPGIKPGDAHNLVSNIPWAAVLTSNYDSLIEDAYNPPKVGKKIEAYSRSGINLALSDLRYGRSFIFKVHGDINNPGSIILSDRDYLRMSYLDPAYRSFLEAIFSCYTVLFVGYGAADPDLNGVLERLSTIYGERQRLS